MSSDWSRRSFLASVGAVSLAGCMGFPGSQQRDKPWVNAHVRPENIKLGVDSRQNLDISIGQVNVMARQLPEENREHQLTIDTSPLAQYGVDVDDLSVEPTQGKWRSSANVNANIETVAITDGVIDLVVVTPETVHDADPIALQLTGFQFADVDAVTEIQYDIHSPTDHVDISDSSHSGNDCSCRFRGSGNGGFKLIDPQQLPPTLCPQSISVEASSQRLLIEWLTPETEELFIEIDVSVLTEYGMVGTAIEEREIWGATLERATVDDSTISMRLVPDSDTSYAAVEVLMEGIDITDADPVNDISYEMTVEGDSHETVETEPFDITEAVDDVV